MASVVLPSQDQLYAYYIARCGHYHVAKPNRAILKLLEDMSPCEVDDAATPDCGATSGETNGAAVGRGTPLAQRRLLRLTDDVTVTGTACRLYLGSRGAMAFIDVLRVLPLLEELDLSNVTSWYDGDEFAHMLGNFTGNAVIRNLCSALTEMPSMTMVNVVGQPIGCAAANDILTTIRACPRLRTFDFSPDGVDPNLCQQIRLALRANKSQAHDTVVQPPPLPTSLPACIAALPTVDRKSVREQLSLHRMLVDDEHFAQAVPLDVLDTLVLHATMMSTSEVLTRCGRGGLRGDGQHLFIIKSGVLRAEVQLQGFHLRRGDYFGDSYPDLLLYPTGTLYEEERGTVYCIPLAHCAALLRTWSTRVSTMYDKLRQAPFLQSVDAWSRLRACTCGVLRTYAPGEEVLRLGDATRALYVVCDGKFLAQPGKREQQEQTGRFLPYTFIANDVFGVESLVAARGCSSVPVTAARDRDVGYCCLSITGCALRILHEQLHSVFTTLARAYSVHEDLCRTRLPTQYQPHCSKAAVNSMYFL